MQFNDGSQLVVQAGVSCITYTSPDGRITRSDLNFDVTFFVKQNGLVTAAKRCPLRRYKENEKLPEHVKEKLHCLSSILGLLANRSTRHLPAH